MSSDTNKGADGEYTSFSRISLDFSKRAMRDPSSVRLTSGNDRQHFIQILACLGRRLDVYAVYAIRKRPRLLQTRILHQVHFVTGNYIHHLLFARKVDFLHPRLHLLLTTPSREVPLKTSPEETYQTPRLQRLLLSTINYVIPASR